MSKENPRKSFVDMVLEVSKGTAFCDIAYNLLEDQFEEIAEEFAVQSNWISVKDRLPTKADADEYGQVLFTSYNTSGKPCNRIVTWKYIKIFPNGGHWQTPPKPPAK